MELEHVLSREADEALQARKGKRPACVAWVCVCSLARELVDSLRIAKRRRPARYSRRGWQEIHAVHICFDFPQHGEEHVKVLENLI